MSAKDVAPTKSLVVSGASSGIGRALVQHAAGAGWRVFALALPGDDLSALAGEQVMAVPADITDDAQVRQAADAIAAAVGTAGLQGLVNNAGINQPGALEALPIEALRRQFEVNVFGHLRLTQALLPLLRTGGGRIVNVSSIMGRVAMPLLGAYSMSKHALEAMTDGLRLELTPWQMHVAAVLPGAVQTPMTDAMPALMDAAQARMTPTLHAQYAPLFAGMRRALQTQGRTAVPPALVVDCIWHALTAARPRPRYAPGAAAQGLLLLRKLAPDAVGDAILRRALGL